MILLGRLPPRQIDSAAEVLEGVLVRAASGNLARVWPVLTPDPEKNQTRIAFFLEWWEPATPHDMAELMAFTDKIMGKPATVVTEGSGDPFTSEENLEWLRSGKPPAPGRTQ